MLKKKCLTCGKAFFKSPSKSMKVWNEEVKYCSVGCSQTVFKKGLVPWNKGKTGYLSDDALRKMSEANKGQHRGKEFKNGDKPPQHRVGCKCFRCTGKVWNAGKVGLYKCSQKTKDKMRKIAKANGFGLWMSGKNGSEGAKEKLRKWAKDNMDLLRAAGCASVKKQDRRKQPTSIEVKVYEELKNRGFLFEKQRVINNKFVVDAYIPKLNLVIEADGNYWHSLDKNKKRDKAKNAYLAKCGFNLLRLTETEINNGSFKDKLPWEE